MKYKIEITGMHCQGCKNLITMSMEEYGFSEISVDYEKGFAIFKGNDNTNENLEKAFTDIPSYKYSNLISLE